VISILAGIIAVIVISYNPDNFDWARAAFLYWTGGEITRDGLKTGDLVEGAHSIFFTGVLGICMAFVAGFTALVLLSFGQIAKSIFCISLATFFGVLGAGATDVANAIYALQSTRLP
jgi:hypothetical protein